MEILSEIGVDPATAFEIKEDTLARLANIPEFKKNSDYNKLEIGPTLEYMDKLYLRSIADYVDFTRATLCDCGAGFGWLAFAFLLRGGRKAIIVEPNEKKNAAARQFADILGVKDRCEFRTQFLEQIDLPDASIDIFTSIETLEHVGKENIVPAIQNMERMTRNVIVLTTPNQMSPFVSHDARLLFSHWLPVPWRPAFARLFGKARDHFCHFAGPWHLNHLRRRFRPVSTVLTFKTYRDWRNHYPFYSPYGGGKWKEKPGYAMCAYLKISSLVLGRYSYWVSPNLGSVWLIRGDV